VNNRWYYITPDGSLYSWGGSNDLSSDPLVESLDSSFWTNTSLLYNASQSPGQGPAVVTINGSSLTINPNDSFMGKFAVTVTVSDGALSDSEVFAVTIQSVSPDTTAPVLASRSPLPGSNVSTSSVSIELTFSEAVSGVDVTDLVLTGAGAANAVVSAPVHVSGLSPSHENHAASVWRFVVSNLVNGPVNVSLAPDANDIEDAAGNDLAPALWSFNVNIQVAPQPPVLAPIGNQSIASSTQDHVVQLSATDGNNDPLTYAATAQTIEYHYDQQLGLSFNGNYDFNWGGLQEKWMPGTGGVYYYIKPDGTLWRWAGSGSASNATLIDTISTAAYANPALLHSAAANAAQAVVSVSGSTLTLNPHDTFTGRFAVTVTVGDGNGGTDSETFFANVLSTGPDTTAPTITGRTPANAATVNSAVTNIDVAFSEAVTGVDVTDLVLTGSGAASAVKTAPTNIGNNTWRFAVSNLANGTVNVALAPDANDIEDAAGNDLAPALWSFNVNIQAAPQPPVLAPIGNQTINSSTQDHVVQLSATDGNNDPLTYAATAQTIEYHYDQQLGLSFNGNYDFNWGGLQEKWMSGPNNTWYYIVPDGRLYRWLGGGLANDPLIDTLTAAYWTNPALLHNAAANNAPAVLSINGNVLTINPTSGFTGKFYVNVSVNDGQGNSDSEQFQVLVT